MNTFFDQAPCLYFAAAGDGTLVDVNETLCAKLAYARDELLGQKADTLFTVVTRIFQQTHLFPLLKMQGCAEEIYVTLQTKGGEPVPVLLNAERKTINDQTVTLYTGIAVHNRKKFEDELIAAKKAAEAALHENTTLQQAQRELQKRTEDLDQQIRLVNQQNEELRQFNRAITHNLQEPLRKLAVFTDMMRKNKEAEEKFTERLLSVADQMRAVVTGLQQYVWLTETPANRTTVDLTALLPDVETVVKKEYPDVRLCVRTEELTPLWADAEHVRLLFYHLLTNAVRFRKPGRDVNVRIFARELLLNAFQNVSDKYDYVAFAKLEVKDDGTGFDPAYKEEVFDLFKRLHSTSGRGVGLSLCRKIVEKHGGKITMDSRQGEGTTVTILLPKAKIH